MTVFVCLNNWREHQYCWDTLTILTVVKGVNLYLFDSGSLQFIERVLRTTIHRHRSVVDGPLTSVTRWTSRDGGNTQGKNLACEVTSLKKGLHPYQRHVVPPQERHTLGLGSFVRSFQPSCHRVPRESFVFLKWEDNLFSFYPLSTLCSTQVSTTGDPFPLKLISIEQLIHLKRDWIEPRLRTYPSSLVHSVALIIECK